MPRQRKINAAKSGFDEEKSIINELLNWKTSKIASVIFTQLSKYNEFKVTDIKSIKPFLWKNYPKPESEDKNKRPKTDIIVDLELKNNKSIIIPISIKSFHGDNAFNHLDRRDLSAYQKILNIPDNIISLLNFFTGESLPREYHFCSNPRDDRRLFMDEMHKDDKKIIIEWFNLNSSKFVNFVFTGNQTVYSPEYILVVKINEGQKKVCIKPIEKVIDLYFGDGKLYVSKRGSLYLGSDISEKALTIQRKGCTCGEKNLQVKFNPNSIFSID